MQLATFLSQYTGLSVDALFNAPGGPLVRPHVDVAKNWTFPGWDEKVLGKASPTSEDVEAALAVGPAPVELVAYANARQWALATGGYTATIGGKPILFATDESSLSALDRKAMRLAQPNPPASVNWQMGPDTFVTIGADDFAHAATKVDDFVQATFDALPAIFAGIASGAIKACADIDKAAWPEASGAVS